MCFYVCMNEPKLLPKMKQLYILLRLNIKSIRVKIPAEYVYVD